MWRILRALRAALGDDVKLRWDPNASYPPAQATVLCQQLEELNLEYYEDPIHGIPGMTQLRARMKTPLATNMCVVNFDHLVTALRQPCVDVVLADLVMWGGIQSMVELGDVTPLFDFDLTIHSAFELGLRHGGESAGGGGAGPGAARHRFRAGEHGARTDRAAHPGACAAASRCRRVQALASSRTGTRSRGLGWMRLSLRGAKRRGNLHDGGLGRRFHSAWRLLRRFASRETVRWAVREGYGCAI